MRSNGFKYKAHHTVKHSRLQLTNQFPDLIARAGLSQRAFARRAGVSFSTIMGLSHPDLHPGRRGGMQRKTAWLLANAYADVAKMSPDEAFSLLIYEQVTDSAGSLSEPCS